MSRKFIMTAAASLALSISALAAPAHALDIASFAQGWVNSAGGADGAVNGNNTFTGNEYGNRFNSWAAFAIPVGTYSAADLALTFQFYQNSVGDEVGLYDVNTAYSDFAASSSGVAGYTDLMSGSLYASTFANDVLTHLISLGGASLADINTAAGGIFIIGFTNITKNGQISGANQDDGVYTNGSAIGQPVLQLSERSAAPEPASWGLMVLGFGGLGAMFRSQRRALAAV